MKLAFECSWWALSVFCYYCQLSQSSQEAYEVGTITQGWVTAPGRGTSGPSHTVRIEQRWSSYTGCFWGSPLMRCWLLVSQATCYLWDQSYVTQGPCAVAKENMGWIGQMGWIHTPAWPLVAAWSLSGATLPSFSFFLWSAEGDTRYCLTWGEQVSGTFPTGNLLKRRTKVS